jgi:uncharacterized protein YndB with AHSA1/START domain
MATKAATADRKVGGIGDAAVTEKTGRSWDEWLAIVDAAGGRTMSHKEIVAVVGGHEGVSGWWCQMVAVGYEQERGLRKKHEKTDGFSVSVSRTLAAPPSTVFKAFSDKRARAKWLADHEPAVRSSTPDKSVRLAWDDGASVVDVRLTPKGERTQVAVEHSKLARESDVERLRAYWSAALDALKAEL